MAGSGNLGGLYMSLDIKSNLARELNSYTQKLNDFDGRIKSLQDSINKASSELDKMAKGSDAWDKQRESVRGMFKEIDTLIGKMGVYERELSAVQQRVEKVSNGGLVGKGFSITSQLDTKPIEQQITKLEKVVQLQEKLQSIQSQRPGNVMDFLFSDRAGNKNYRAYSASVETYRNQVTDVMSQLKAIGGENVGVADAKRQLESLYSTLARFEQANQRATSSVRDSRSELDKHAAKQKEVEIAFQGVMAAQRREAQQEAANRANIESTNAARQRQVEVLRQQSEALMRNKLSTLESQRSQMAGLYSKGRAVGLDAAELENIRQRYREISQEILNMQTMLQHAKGLSYNDMFASGRTIGSGGAFIRDAAGQIARVRQETLDTTRAARDLASAFNQVHRSASQSSQVLGDIKSMFLQGGIVYGAQRFANAIVRTGGDIVQQHIALQSIIGDVQKANILFAQTQQLALQSPFKFGELNRDVKQLAAFGVETDVLYDRTKRLADISAGLGVSFERLGLAYGQTKARSWLDGKELRQMAYAGLPMLQRIAEYYNDIGKNGKNNYTTSGIRDMITKRQVSFQDVDQIFKRLTDEGGQFYNMQFVLSETLLGKWNKLIDAWDIMLGKLADGKSAVGSMFMYGIDMATQFILTLDKITPILMSFGAFFGGKRILKGLVGSFGFNDDALTKQFDAARISSLKLYASRQAQNIMEGKITAQVASQNILKRKQLLETQAVKDASVMQLFSEGKISISEMGSLARRKAISIELINQMRSMEIITAKEAEMLTLIRAEGTSRKAIAAQMRLGGQGFLGKFGGLFSKTNIMLAAISAIAGAIGSYRQFSDEISQKSEDMAASAKQHAESLQDVYDRVKNIGEGGTLSDQVRSMKDVLASSGLFTNSIQDQIAHAKSLNEQYTILKGRIRDAIKESELTKSNKDIVANALKDAKTMPLLPEYKFGKATSWLTSLFDESLLNSLPSKLWIFPFLGNRSIDENITKYNKMAVSFERLKNAGKDTETASKNVKKAWDDLANNNLARILQSLRIRLNVNATSFSTWSKTVRSSFENALVGVLGSLENADDILKARLYAYAKIRTLHPSWDLNDPKINGERGGHPVAVWMRYYLDNYRDRQRSQVLGEGGEGNQGSKRDTFFEMIRNRVELYKKFYSEYKKLSSILGERGAILNLEKSGDFSSVFGFGLSDVTNFSNSLDQLTSSLSRTTEERRKFLNDTDAEKAAKARQDIEQKIKDDVSDLNYELGVMKAGYDIYKKIVSVTGDKDLANRVAFSGASVSTPKELLRSQMARQFGGDTAKADATLAMSREEINSKYGINSAIGSIWEKNLDNIKESRKESKELYVDILTKHQTLQDQIDAENSLYEQQIELLKQNKDLTPEQYEKAKTSLDTDHAQKLGDIRFRQFKQDSGWEQIFRDLDRVSVKTIDNLLSGLRTLLSTNDMSVEGTKAVIEAIDKLMERREKVSPFSSIANGYGTLRTIQSIRNAGTNANGNYTLTGDQEKALGLKKTPNREHTENDLNDAEANVFKGFENSIKGIQEAFEGLQAVLSPVAELFDALGNSGLSDALNVGGKALGSASGAIGGMSSLKSLVGDSSGLGKALGSAGPYAAAAAAALSIASSIIGGKSASQKAYEKQAEYLKNIQGTVSEINGSLKEKVSSSYGSASQQAGMAVDENLKLEAAEARKTYYKWSMAKKSNGGNRNRMKTNLDFNQINAYLREIGYTGPDVGGDSIQTLSGDYLEKIREHFPGMWAKIPDEAKEVLNRIIEIEKESGEIAKNAEATAKALTDMDLDTLKSEYKDLLDQLDSDNEDFADNFEKHLRDAILSGMLANLYADRIAEMKKNTAKAGGTEKGNKYIDKYGNVRTHTGGDDSANVASEYTPEEYQKSAEEASSLGDEILNTRDMLARLYGWSDNSSSKAGSSIKGITEEQADLLASYLNACRADLSVVRKEIGNYYPQMSEIAKSQLTQLNMIAQNTLRNAEAAERIDVSVTELSNNVRQVINGTKQIHVK